MEALVHTKLNSDDLWENYAFEIQTVPSKGDLVSFSANGQIYEVIHILHNYFSCTYPIEIFARLSNFPK